MSYTAPVDDIAFALGGMARAERLESLGAFPDFAGEDVQAVLEEAGRFADNVLAPLNVAGDRDPARLENGVVVTSPGWKEAYAAFVEAGWNALPFPESAGGQNLPFALNAAVSEAMYAAVPALSLVPLLTQGAADLLIAHGTEEQRRLYLPHLVSGEWTATMQLTEPQSGSDLSDLRTRAEPAGDGTYRLRGSKIFISGGDHDMVPNIVHLVLGRLPDAPEGTRGISLFLVPKLLVEPDGRIGPRNDLRAVSLEHKMGFHGSPTCVMAYGENEGALCTLIGEPHRGLAAMFTMMNSSRLMVGVQGVAVAERATQQARAFAAERRQGRAPGAADGPQVSIDAHPDVQRMLATMAARTAAARALCLEAAVVFDLAHKAEGPERQRHHARLQLLTPLAKAFATEAGVDVASLGVQVHGGMGYIEETGAAQHLRDARVLPIYEGTNGIQAVDLLTRKLRRDGGAEAGAQIAEIREVVDRLLGSDGAALGGMGYRLSEAAGHLEAATGWLLEVDEEDIVQALAGASDYLRLFGVTLAASLLARGALAAVAAGAEAGPAAGRALGLARFYADNMLVAAGSLRQAIVGGAPSLIALGIGADAAE